MVKRYKYLVLFFLFSNILCYSIDEEITDMYNRAMEYEKNGEIVKAVIMYKRCNKDLKDEKIALKIARIIPDFNDSIKEYKQFINDYPRSRFRFLARYELAILYKIKGDNQNSLKEFTNLSRISRGNIYWDESVLNIALLEFLNKNYKESIERLNELLGATENYEILGNVYYFLGRNMTDQGNYSEAENYFLICAGNFPESTKACPSLLELLDIFIKENRFDYAKKIIQLINQLYPDSFENKMANEKYLKIKEKLKDAKDVEIELKNLNNNYDIIEKNKKRMINDLNLSLKLNLDNDDLKNNKNINTNEKKSGFYVQLAYLSTQESAKKIVDEYIKKGITGVYYARTRSNKSSDIFYRVVIGPFDSEEYANEKVIELKDKNIESIVMELDKYYE